MHPSDMLPRSLLDHPQRWGFLPTTWFWNDLDRQRLVLPLIAAASLVVAPLLLWSTIRLDLSVWPFIAASLLVPYLITGLVERHVRRQLARRPPELRLLGVVASAPASFPGQRVFAALALTSGVMTLLAVLEVSRAALLAGLVMSVGASCVIALVPRARRALQAARPCLSPDDGPARRE